MPRLTCAKQTHSQGCFYGALAGLLGTSYREAFRRVHGDANIDRLWHFPILRADSVEQVLSSLGIKFRISNARRVKSLRHNALLIIRWWYDPRFSHTLIWDAEQRKLLDPARLGLSFDQVEEQLYKVLYIDEVPNA